MSDTLTLAVAALQLDAITAAAGMAGVAVEEYVIDAAVRQAVNQIGMGLGGCVDAERAYIAADRGTVCGATLELTDPNGQPFTITCVRVAGHLVDGVVARESHVAVVATPSGEQYTQWLDGQ